MGYEDDRHFAAGNISGFGKIMFHSNSNLISDFQGLPLPFQSNLTKDPLQDELGTPWIMIARAWALVVSFFGVPGNLITASTIIHQLFLHQRRQRLHSISDSCFHQMKVIKEGSLSGSSESSSANSVFQRKKTLFCNRTPSNAPPTSIDTPEKQPRRNSKKLMDPFMERNSLHADLFNSRESSPGVLSSEKYFIAIESPPRNSSNERSFLQLKPGYDGYSFVVPSSAESSFREDSETDGVPAVVKNEANNIHPSSRDLSPTLGHFSCRESMSPDRISVVGGGCDNMNNGGGVTGGEGTSTPNGEASFSMSSSQVSKHHKSLARKSNSLRSQQSVSLNRYEVAPNPPIKQPLMRVEGDTILILHIIICDLLYCAVSLPHTYYVYGFQSVDGHIPAFCKEAAFLRYVNAFAEWMTLGLLAIQRCIDLAKPPNARFFKMKSTIYFVIGIWVLSTILQVSNLINKNFSYNNETRKCDYTGHVTSMLYFYSLDSFLPCSLMIFGCFSIIFQIVRNKRRLQKFGMSAEVVALREREMWQSACLVLSLLLLFLICVIPICIFNVLYTLEVIDNSEIGVILYMVYWVQYGINFIVYATSKRKFRIAYKSFFTVVCMQFKRCCHGNVSAHDVEAIDDL